MCTRKCPIGFRDYKGDFMKGVRTSQLCTRFNRDFIRNFKLIQYGKTIKFNSILSSLQKFQISAKHKKFLN